MPLWETMKPTDARPRPFLAPSPTEKAKSNQSSPSGLMRPVTTNVPALSSVHFVVHAGMAEVQLLADQRGWFSRGFTTLSIPWTEMHWTTDNWKTVKVLKSTDAPCPVVNGSYFLSNVPVGTEIDFAIRAGIACHAPHDTAGNRDNAELWFNNAGQNYKQTTK